MNLVERDTIKSVSQNISIILTTPKGSDPHRPLFGSDLWQFLDKPLTVITKGRIKAEIVSAIQIWEPRIEIEEVVLKKEYSQLHVVIRYRLKEEETIHTEEMVL